MDASSHPSLVNHAPVYYTKQFMTENEATKLYEELKQHHIKRHSYLNKKLKRDTAIFGDSLNNNPPKIWGENAIIEKWTPSMKLLLDKLNIHLKEKFNICLVNSYENGKEFIGWHADNEEKGSTYCIASISLGAPRTFSFLYRSRELGGEEEKMDIILEHGSLLLMKHPCQDKYLHCLPLDKKIKSRRINLTFRKLSLE